MKDFSYQNDTSAQSFLLRYAASTTILTGFCVLKDDCPKGSRVIVISRCFSLKFGSNEKEGITFPCDDDYDQSRQLYCASHREYFHSRSIGRCGELQENGRFGKQTSETFPFSFQSFVMYIKVISSKRYFFSSLTQEAKVKLLKKMY